MLTGVVCYIERTHGGNGLRRVRLVGPELDQTWVAPSVAGDDDTRAPAPGEQIAHIRAAAAWIADEIAPVRELAAVSLDPEGGVCSWVSAPSADPQVVLAAIRQGAAAPRAGEPGAPQGGFGLLPDESLGMGSGRSVQALAPPESKGHPSRVSAASKAAGIGPRKRLGVLSVADAPVRVLLDELDRLKIGVGSVLSFWHAAALAWDPGVEARPSGKRRAPSRNGTHDPAALEPIVVEPEAAVTATVVVDPSGRLIWAWSKGGELLAAGAIRLRTHTYSRAEPHAPEPAHEIERSELDSVTRRLPIETEAEVIHAAECSAGDVGRLVMDWLSWSVQIGHTPDRVVCIGPATIPHRPAPNETPPTPESLARSLAAAWPSAGVDAAIHDDPVGATLNRLRALPMFAPARTPPGDLTAEDDPRLNLVMLTARPGRLVRTLHYWATLAILAAAAGVFIYAQRLGAGIEGLRTRTAEVQTRRLELLQSVEDLVPTASKTADPVGLLSSRIQEYNDQLKRLDSSRPLLPHLLAALEILGAPEFSNIQITGVQLSDIRLVINFNFPETEDFTVAQVMGKLDDKFGAGVWDHTLSRAGSGGRRPCELSWVNPQGGGR